MEVPAQGLLTILMLLPVAAGVGFLAYNVGRHIVKTTLKQHQAQTGNPAAEIERIRAKDRADARALYERVTKDKLEVVKTALAMGYSRQDLADLDDRLEELIGTEKLHKLLESDSPTAPSVKDEILDADLVSQLESLRPGKERE